MTHSYWMMSLYHQNVLILNLNVLMNVCNQGKEGFVSDCIACSLSSIVFRMRLRLKVDEQELIYQNWQILPIQLQLF